MAEETIVAVYDTAAHADAAVQDLRAANVPADAISRHAEATALGTGTAAEPAPVREGFWRSLFGTNTAYDQDASVYDRSLAGGSTVVSVRVLDQHVAGVMDILERHNPVDIEDRAASYGVSQKTTDADSADVADATAVPAASRPTPAATGDQTATGTVTDGGTIELAEERLSVGKRAVNRGTTRIRRYVVEIPVHEQVALRDEKVSVERRPLADARPVTGADFTDKVVEVAETSEEAVVSKTARVKEEVVIRKDATERTETVNDTVRRQEVEITNEPDVERMNDPATTAPIATKPKI